MALDERHAKTLKRHGQIWAVQPVHHDGANKVVIELADGDYVYVQPSVAAAFGRALIAAAQAAVDDEG
jgi:hypothetical protein